MAHLLRAVDPLRYTFYIDELPVYRTSAAVSHIPEPIYLTCEVNDGGWSGYVPAGGFGSREASTRGWSGLGPRVDAAAVILFALTHSRRDSPDVRSH